MVNLVIFLDHLWVYTFLLEPLHCMKNYLNDIVVEHSIPLIKQGYEQFEWYLGIMKINERHNTFF